MISPRKLVLPAALVLLAAPLCLAHEIFPVVHYEPITVRILSGESGRPLAYSHLILIGGYDRTDMHEQFFREEALTDAVGRAHISGQLANLPWLQVWVNRKPLCQTNPRKASFSVELIRRDGLSAPNHCGTFTVQDAPGIFTVFVKSKSKNTPAQASLEAPEPHANPQVVASAPAMEAPAQAVAQSAAPAAVAVPAPPAVQSAPVEAAPPAHKDAAALSTPAAIAPAAPSIVQPHRTVAHAAVRPSAHRATPVAHSSVQPVHRAHPQLASCPVERTAAPARVNSDLSAERTARARARALGYAYKPKPAAGVPMKPAAANPEAPAKQ
jgi:hypothetical protein